MMKFKRITAFLLILCMVMIGGCSQEEAVDPVKTAVQTAENYLFNKDYKNGWHQYMMSSGLKPEKIIGVRFLLIFVIFLISIFILINDKYSALIVGSKKEYHRVVEMTACP